ncbi:MAG: hypothetical protein IJU48_01365 [Synergistaceae bacterium]|nr:hypothetical protein [Synergistaceae bacterium]
MKRSLINIFKILLFIIGFLYALYAFMEWQEVGKFAMSTAHSYLARQGMRVNYSDVSGVSDGFTVHNLTLSGMVNISFNSVTIRPRFLASVMNLAPTAEISFKGGSVQIGQVINFGDGGFTLIARPSEIMLDQLRTNGEFGINGYMSINTASMKIGRANARLNVPEEFLPNMEMMMNFLPLMRAGDTWYLQR